MPSKYATKVAQRLTGRGRVKIITLLESHRHADKDNGVGTHGCCTVCGSELKIDKIVHTPVRAGSH